jgi:hypothetical protein
VRARADSVHNVWNGAQGRGLEILEDEDGGANASADNGMFIKAMLTLFLYVLLGMLFYGFVEEHCDTETTETVVVGGATITGQGLMLQGVNATNATITSTTTESCTPWTAIDSAYFTVLTFTTIGYGDFSPVRAPPSFPPSPQPPPPL